MSESHSKPKTIKKTPKKRKQQSSKAKNSNTKVLLNNFIENRWKSEKRDLVTIRMNKKLYLEFKTVAKVIYGSVCNPLENFMAVTILSSEEKLYLCNTQNPISIGKIVIERNLRPRRKLELRGDVEDRKVVRELVETVERQVDKGIQRMTRIFGGIVDQWDWIRSNRDNWRLNCYNHAKKYPELEEAQQILRLYES